MILIFTSSSLILKMPLTDKPKKATEITSEFWDTEEDRKTCGDDTRRIPSESNSRWENKCFFCHR